MEAATFSRWAQGVRSNHWGPDQMFDKIQSLSQQWAAFHICQREKEKSTNRLMLKEDGEVPKQNQELHNNFQEDTSNTKMADI